MPLRFQDGKDGGSVTRLPVESGICMKENLRVGPYEFLNPLGSGGQGSVWLATDTRNGVKVAIKVLPPGTWGAIELARLRRESRLLLTFSDPGLPAGIGVIEDGTQRVYGFVMQYVEGIALHQALRERILSPKEIALIGCELARILSVLHARGVVHRDVKMANVVLRPGWETGSPGTIVLVDLGIARGLESNAATAYTAPGSLVGSAPYVAPELLFFTGEIGPSCAVDVFSLGVLIWLLLFRKHPTGLPMSADFQEFLDKYRGGSFVVPDPQRAEEVQASVPGLLPVLYRSLEFSLSRRYISAMQVHEALLAVMGRPSQRPAPVTLDMDVKAPLPAPTVDMAALVIPPMQKPSKWKTVAIVAVGFVVIAAATTLGVIWVWR
ncbi:MAG: serine/threonine protein kinase [Deltaproteobacteria bacterium]|nr:serine/threonine protein kinase [Deltaproteobacteria bacterium]